jgi:hypothetical protein
MNKQTREYIEAAEKSLEETSHHDVAPATYALLALTAAIDDLKQQIINEITMLHREQR